MATVSEPLVAAPATTVLYMSRRRQLRLVKTPEYPILGPGGRVVGSEPGETLEFHDGACHVPREGEVTLANGKKADAAEIHAWLDKHPRFGDIDEGFWGVPAITPTVSQEEMNRLVTAALALDEDTLKAMVEQETAGYGRAEIIEEAQGALVKIEDMRAEAEKEKAKAETEPKA